MLELGNYILLSGHHVKIKELYQDGLRVEYPDRTLVNTKYEDIRFIELGSNVLKKLCDIEGNYVCKLQKKHQHPLHEKEFYEVNLKGKKFYLHGYLYDDISIWHFINTFTLHYLHQLQNTITLLNPTVELSI
jgi:hypothetical protein